MPEKHTDTFEVNGHEYLRVPVTASLRMVDEGEVPEPARATAAQLHFKDKVNPDLTWVHFILDSEGANANWDYMPRPALAKHFGTAKYKPFDMEHVIKEDASMMYMDRTSPPVKNTIFGVMTSASLADAQGNPLSDEQVADLDLSDNYHRAESDRITVTAWAALYSFLFPKTVSQLVQATDQGQMHVSMERWISDWDYLVQEGGEMKAMAREDAQQRGVAAQWSAHQEVNGAPVWRRSNAFVYGGCASTGNPANTMATFVEPELAKAAAHTQKNDPVFKELTHAHSEVHREWAVSTSEQQPSLIARHEQITRLLATYLGAVT